jgi:alpha-aminoadipate carrier protein LysW
MVQCKECGAEIELALDVVENEIITCPDCGFEWEVRSLNPIVLEPAPKVEEDWGE